jgi:hypothetical protein
MQNTRASRIGNSLQLPLSERCQVFESDRSELLSLILGKSKNCKVTSLENKENVEARQSTFSTEIHELTMLYVGCDVIKV